MPCTGTSQTINPCLPCSVLPSHHHLCIDAIQVWAESIACFFAQACLPTEGIAFLRKVPAVVIPALLPSLISSSLPFSLPLLPSNPGFATTIDPSVSVNFQPRRRCQHSLPLHPPNLIFHKLVWIAAPRVARERVGCSSYAVLRAERRGRERVALRGWGMGDREGKGRNERWDRSRTVTGLC